MICKDDFFNLLYAKSKMTFKTYSWPLSKLVVQLKTHLLCILKGLYWKIKLVFENFCATACATNLAQNTDVRYNYTVMSLL